MPIGGSNIGWDNTSPADTESAGLGDDRIRSLKTSLQEGLDNEHNWASGGGANTGYHRLGSARPFYGTQSAVSSSGSDGRLMLTSDTSRLFGVGSGGTVLLGGPTVLSIDSFPGSTPQRHYWAIEFGVVTASSGTANITFPNSGFSGVPFVQATAHTGGGSIPVVTIETRTASGATLRLVDSVAGGPINADIGWLSIGTRVL